MKKILIILIIIIACFIFLRDGNSGPNVSQNGISPVQLADNIMSKYDSNSDEKLNVVEESFLRIESKNVLKVESRGLLFTDADAFGNSDGSVSNAELVDYLDEFDTDGNGEITTFKNIFDSMKNRKSEWAKFDKKYGERYKYEEI